MAFRYIQSLIASFFLVILLFKAKNDDVNFIIGVTI